MIAFGLIGMMVGCGPSKPHDPGVLLVALDGVRADRLGSAGHLPTDTPNLDLLASQGTRFARAYSVSTSGPAALATVLSGLTPSVHGHRSTKALQRFPSDGWSSDLTVSRLSHDGDSKLKLVSFEVDISDKPDVTIWLGGLKELSQSVEASAYDEALGHLDAEVGKLVAAWVESNPEGHVVVVGLRGSLSGARFDAELSLTDDWLHVPMIMLGPNIEPGWVVESPVSTLDLGAWFADRFEQTMVLPGRNALHGGSPRAYHESPLAWERFGAPLLKGFTDTSGRYVYGTFGSWYGHQGTAVRSYPDPSSEYPEQHLALQELVAGFGGNEGVAGGDASGDPRMFSEPMSLVNKARGALKKGRIHAAHRMVERLESMHPSAPAVKELRAALPPLSE